MAKKTDQIKLLEDYRTVFSSAAGSRVLNDLMRTHRIMDSTFCKDPMEMALREGERNAVLRILAILKINPNTIRERIENDEKIRANEAIV